MKSRDNNGIEEYVKNVLVRDGRGKLVNRYTGVPVDRGEVDLMLQNTDVDVSIEDVRQVKVI